MRVYVFQISKKTWRQFPKQYLNAASWLLMESSQVNIYFSKTTYSTALQKVTCSVYIKNTPAQRYTNVHRNGSGGILGL